MEIWLIVVISLLISLSLSSLLKSLFLSSSSTAKKLPPGPPTAPVIGSYLWLRKSFWDLEPILRKLRLQHGPLISLRLGPRLIIFVGSHSVAHRALIQNGAVFSDRPKHFAGFGRPSISSSAYGPTWRLLRRNLTSEILHPARVKSFSHARRWVLNILIRRLRESAACDGKAITLVDHLQYAMFCLLALMCFGDKLVEKQVKEIETVQRNLLLNNRRFNILNLFPRLGKILFRNRWKELIQMRENRENVLIPLIKARIEIVKQRKQRQQSEEEEEGGVISYVDSLLDLELPEEKRKLRENEIVSLCGEFFDAGTDTTATALQWIMANLVKYPQIQSRLHEQIKGVMGHKVASEDVDIIQEEDLQRMGYLKAVVLEGLRRHPPAHFVVPHAVTEDVELEGYLVPKDTSVNFMVAEMGWDPKVWEEPMEFRPERFTCGGSNGSCDGGEEEETVFDITGSKEIKMMPFGVGRRICPGANLAMLHLEFFVANLVWYFEWTAADGDGVDLAEKQEFTVVMKNPLRVRISPRA